MSHVFLATKNYYRKMYNFRYAFFHMTHKLGYQQKFQKSIIQQIVKRINYCRELRPKFNVSFHFNVLFSASYTVY